MSEPDVVFEDNDFLVVNKLAGMLVHGTKVSSAKCQVSGKKEETLVDWLLERYPEIRGVGDDPEQRPGIVHRLDRETSGIMIVARNQASFGYLKSLFQEQRVSKSYIALVFGRMGNKKGVIDRPIGLKSGTTKRTIFGGKMIKKAVTEYEVEREFCSSNNHGGKEKIFSLVKVFPKTGRTHQIRVHLASIGHPVVNDLIYAKSRERVGGGRMMLHALSLEFSRRDGKRFKIEAEAPKDFTEIISSVENSN